METRISYLQTPKKEANLRPVLLRRLSSRYGAAETGREERSPAADFSIQQFTETPMRAGRATKAKWAIRTFYKWLIRVVLLGMLILLASLILFMWAPAAHPGTAKEIAPSPRMTAKGAYDMARPVALGWADDPQLISLSASWESGRNFRGGEGEWSLLFYSPIQAATALVSVVEGRATIIDAHGVTQAPPIQPIDLWQLDSPAVLALIMSNGGDEFLRSQPDACLALSLNLQSQGVWSGRLIHRDSQRVFAVQIGIDDGEIIDVRQSG